MTSLIEAVIEELVFYTPEATPDQIKNYIIELMEREVLPEAIKNTSFPQRPSPVEKLRLRQWLKRVGKKRRPREEKRQEMWRVVEQFESIREAIGGAPHDISDFRRRESDYLSGTSILIQRRPLHGTLLTRRPSIGDGFPVAESSFLKKRAEELEDRPYNPFREEEKKTGFYFDRTIHNKILAEPLFSRNVGVIESAARLFALSKSLKANYFMSFRKDLEIPEWEKYILTITSLELDFDEKMKLWDEFDYFIREQIRERSAYMSGEQSEKLTKLNKALFTRVELKVE